MLAAARRCAARGRRLCPSPCAAALASPAARARPLSSSAAGPWQQLDDGLRYRLSEDAVSGTETIEIEHGAVSPTASVILTHGLGDSARGWAGAALQLAEGLPWTRWVLPTAPTQPVTLNGGMSMPSWYDIEGLSDRASETCEGIDRAQETLERLAQAELEELGDANAGRLVLAGFSQGGALSLHTALRWEGEPLPAGVLCMSGYLPCPGSAPEQSTVRETPMLICHGDADPMVR